MKRVPTRNLINFKMLLLAAVLLGLMPDFVTGEVKATFSFNDCEDPKPDAIGNCFSQPTNKMKNKLNQCKCEIFQYLGPLMAPREGKKPCKLQLPAPLQTLAAAFLMPINFVIKMCFWKKMDLTDGKSIKYDNFKGFIDQFNCDAKVKTALKEKIDKCISPDVPVELPFNMSYIPLLPEIIKRVLNADDFRKSQCIGHSFGQVCTDVPNLDMKKVAEKFKGLPPLVTTVLAAIPVGVLFGEESLDAVKLSKALLSGAVGGVKDAVSGTGGKVPGSVGSTFG